MLDLHLCWKCKKKLSSLSKEDMDKLIENKIFFHCSKECMETCEITNYKPKVLKWEKEEKKKDDKEKIEPKKEEKKEEKTKKVQTCTICKKEGHNKRKCTEK